MLPMFGAGPTPMAEVMQAAEPAVAEHSRLAIVIRQLVFLGLPVHISLVAAFTYFEQPALAALNVLSSIAWIVGYRANEQRRHAVAVTLLTVEVLVHSAVVTGVLGQDYGYQFYLFATIPFTMFNTRLQSRHVGWVATFTCSLYLALYIGAPQRAVTLHSDLFVHAVYGLNVAIAFAAVGVISLFFREASIEAEDGQRQQRARADALLLNMLPPSIAVRLKQGEGTIADSFTDVTVLFADLVGFTAMSARLQPEELVEYLDAIFGEFDHVASRLGLEKIKTIGDAYMVAGGLPLPSENAAEAVAQLALEMNEIVKRRSEQTGEDLALRIGINSGPVVAGVIGRQKFLYDLWGDAVNVASRMESRGEPGRIQVTEATMLRLQDVFTFEARGEIEVKGKGLMPTWFLGERKQPEGSDSAKAA